MLRILPLALATLFGCDSAWSQSVTYLSPSQWRAELGDSVEAKPAGLVRSWGTVRRSPVANAAPSKRSRPEPLRWAERSTDVLFVRGAGTQANFDAPPMSARAVAKQQGSGNEAPPQRELRFKPEGADTWMVGVDWEPRTEQVSGRELNSFLEFHHEAWPSGTSAEQAHVRVTRHESSKMLMVVPNANGRSGSSGTAMSKTAQRAQLRPLNDPCMTVPGTALILRLYLPEGVALNRTGTATQLDSGETVPFPFNEGGFGAVTIPSAGPWLVEVHAVVAPGSEGQQTRSLRAGRNGPITDVLIHTVTLAFEAPPAPPKEKAAPSKEER